MNGVLHGQVALVTGGGSGIGLACARHLARDGAAVVLAGRTESKLAAAAEGLRAAGADVATVMCDVTDEAQVAAAIALAVSTWGRLDIMFNNAGIIASVGRLEDFSFADIAHSFDVNATGPLFCAREAVRRMAKKFGGAGGASGNHRARSRCTVPMSP